MTSSFSGLRASAPTQLIGRLERLLGYARRAGWGDVLDALGPVVKDLRKTERERSWPMGRCLWCEIDANRLREATVSDPGGGPAMCEQHWQDFNNERTAAA